MNPVPQTHPHHQVSRDLCLGLLYYPMAGSRSSWNGVVRQISVRDPADHDQVWRELQPYLSYNYTSMGPLSFVSLRHIRYAFSLGLWPAPTYLKVHEQYAGQVFWYGYSPDMHCALVSRYGPHMLRAVRSMPSDSFLRGVGALATCIDLIHAESDIRFGLEADGNQCRITLPVCPWCTPDDPCMLWYHMFNDMVVWLHDPARRRPAHQLVVDTAVSSGHDLVIRRGGSA